MWKIQYQNGGTIDLRTVGKFTASDIKRPKKGISSCKMTDI